MLYSSSSARRLLEVREQPQDVVKMVNSVKKQVSQALLIVFKGPYIIGPIDTTKWGGSELGGLPPTSERERKRDLGKGGPG